MISWRSWEAGLAEARASHLPVLVSADPGWTTAGQRLDRLAARDDRLGRAFCRTCVAVRIDLFTQSERAGQLRAWCGRFSGRSGPPTLVVLTPLHEPMAAFTDLDYEGSSRLGQPLAAVLEHARATLDGVGGAHPPPDTTPSAGSFLVDPSDLAWRLHSAEDDKRSLKTLRAYLDGILCGSVHDHVGGGFHRGGADASWSVVHSEKLILENAEMAAFLGQAAALLNDRALRDASIETAAFVERCLRMDPHAKAVAADDRHYLWTAKEFHDALPRSVEKAAGLRFGIEGEAGPKALNVALGEKEVATRLGLSDRQAKAGLTTALRALRAARERRPAPHIISASCEQTERAIREALDRAERWTGPPRPPHRSRRAREHGDARHGQTVV